MMSKCEFIQGDALESLKEIPDCSVQCVVTSPPYYGLRDYGVECQMGLEADLPTFIANMTAVFREVRRVLKNDGTLWLNMGDSYAASGKNRTVVQATVNTTLQGSTRSQCASLKQNPKNDLPRKNMLGVPWRLAFALQDDGWVLRQDIIWQKTNPLPESVKDRCTKSHEYLFLLSKSPRYYFDQDAIKEPSNGTENRSRRVVGGAKSHRGSEFHTGKTGEHQQGRSSPAPRSNVSFASAIAGLVETRNKRSVWTISNARCSEAHFATFPVALVEPCVLAGSRMGDVVLDPFAGSYTVGVAAIGLRRKHIGIELNPEYIEIGKRRLAPLLAQPDIFD